MADYCYQCTVDIMMGPPPGDLNDVCSKEPNDYAMVICEGCGITRVDYRGWCISPHCLEAHGEPTPVALARYEAIWAAWERRQGLFGFFLRLKDWFLGTDYEPGFIHGVRYWWHSVVR